MEKFWGENVRSTSTSITRTVHITHLTPPNLISTDFISFQLSGCEATQIVVALTNQNAAVGRAADSEGQ